MQIPFVFRFILPLNTEYSIQTIEARDSGKVLSTIRVQRHFDWKVSKATETEKSGRTGKGYSIRNQMSRLRCATLDMTRYINFSSVYHIIPAKQSWSSSIHLSIKF